MLLKKLNIGNKKNFFLLIFSALLFSYFFTLTFIKQKNISYSEYDILINNSLDKKYNLIKGDILIKIYADFFNIIKSNQRFSLYHRYPHVYDWINKGVLHTQNKIQLKDFIIQYEKTLNNYNPYKCSKYSIILQTKDFEDCLIYRSLWLDFNDTRKYVDFFNQNITLKNGKNIGVKFFFLKCFSICLIFFFYVFLLLKKQINKT